MIERSQSRLANMGLKQMVLDGRIKNIYGYVLLGLVLDYKIQSENDSRIFPNLPLSGNP